MSLKWHGPDFVKDFAATSHDGYYGIANGPPFKAMHIEALWARATPIGTADTLDAAKLLCDKHRGQPRPQQ